MSFGRRKRELDRLDGTIFSDFEQWSTTSRRQLNVLYSSPFAVQCVFRSLPPIARLYVIRVLYLPVSSPDFETSSFREVLVRRQLARDRHSAALSVLRNLCIFVPAVQEDAKPADENDNTSNSVIAFGENVDTGALRLNPVFAEQLRLAISGTVPPVFNDSLDKYRDVHELDRYSAECLENVLNFAIGNDSESDQTTSTAFVPCKEIRNALSTTRILAPCDSGKFLRITNVGFQFLLKSSYSQVWVLLRDVIENAYGDFKFEALNFVFQLSFASCGRGYANNALSTAQRDLLPCLSELGIVALSADTPVFFPTWLGVNLVSSASRADSESPVLRSKQSEQTAKTAGDVQIVVETNFRLYAYTTSAFQMNLLGLFTHLRYQLPNLVVGHITREKAREALMNGIRASQIIDFLNSHAHPRMKNGVIPSNVRDEIMLWEAEQNRVRFTQGFLLSDFDSADQFNQVLSRSSDIGACLWHSSTRRQLVVDRQSYDTVRKYVQSLQR